MTAPCRTNRQEILLTDMSRCSPTKALSEKARRGHWQLVDYKTDEVSGTMVMARPETGAPELTLPLNAEGWYAIHLGVRNALYTSVACIGDHQSTLVRRSPVSPPESTRPPFS